MEKTFYRVGTTDQSGMWYDQKGNFHGAMNTPAFRMLKCSEVRMPFCKETAGFLSATETIEELEGWFPKEDMAVLKPLGFKILAYKATVYKYHEQNKHWLIDQKTSVLINQCSEGLK